MLKLEEREKDRCSHRLTLSLCQLLQRIRSNKKGYIPGKSVQILKADLQLKTHQHLLISQLVQILHALQAVAMLNHQRCLTVQVVFAVATR